MSAQRGWALVGGLYVLPYAEGLVRKRGKRWEMWISNRNANPTFHWACIGWAKSLRHAKAHVAYNCHFNGYKDMVFD